MTCEWYKHIYLAWLVFLLKKKCSWAPIIQQCKTFSFSYSEGTFWFFSRQNRWFHCPSWCFRLVLVLLLTLPSLIVGLDTSWSHVKRFSSLLNFDAEKERTVLATVAGIVVNVRRATGRLGNRLSEFEDLIALRTSQGERVFSAKSAEHIHCRLWNSSVSVFKIILKISFVGQYWCVLLWTTGSHGLSVVDQPN